MRKKRRMIFLVVEPQEMFKTLITIINLKTMFKKQKTALFAMGLALAFTACEKVSTISGVATDDWDPNLALARLYSLVFGRQLDG